ARVEFVVHKPRPAAREYDPLVDDVGRELRGRSLEGDADRLDDLVDRLEERGADLLVGDLSRRGHPGDQVAAFDLHRLHFVARIRRPDGDLDELRGPLTDEKVVLAL